MIPSKIFRLLFSSTINIVICILLIILWSYSSKQGIDSYFYNSFIRYTARPNWNEDFVIINITDEDIEKYGRWPWDRDLLARFIYKLEEQEPSVIALDILFSEPSPKDEQLISAFNKTKRVVGAAAISSDKEFILPLEEFINSYKDIGHTAVYTNELGTPFSIPTVLYNKGNAYYSLGTATYVSHRLYNFELPEQINNPELIINWYRGMPDNMYTFSQILESETPNNKFTNKIVFISLDVTGLDRVMTPFGYQSYGGFVHATFINNLLNQDSINISTIPFYIQIVSVFFVSSLISSFNIKLKLSFGIIIYIVISAIFISITYYSLLIYNTWFSLIPAVSALVGQFISSSLIIRFNIKNRISALMKAAYIDKLTGIPNRRRFDEELLERWDKAVIHDISIAIILIDIDNFKKYNDTYGHQMGDVCLTKVAQTINKETRQYDLCARYGGEEFVILCSTSNLNIMCSRINKAVENLSIPHEKNVKGVVTISMGAILCNPHKQSCTPKSIIELADKGLYESKEKGRNTYTIIKFNKES